MYMHTKDYENIPRGLKVIVIFTNDYGRTNIVTIGHSL